MEKASETRSYSKVVTEWGVNGSAGLSRKPRRTYGRQLRNQRRNVRPTFSEAPNPALRNGLLCVRHDGTLSVLDDLLGRIFRKR